MATRRDLAQAQSFERRRVVAALDAGAPDGQEAEPARLGRLLLGGAALAALVLLGSAAAGPLEEALAAPAPHDPAPGAVPGGPANAKEPPTRTSRAPAGGG